MSSKLDNLLPAIIGANDAGLTVGAIKAKFIGKSSAKTKDREAELRERLQRVPCRVNQDFQGAPTARV